MTENHRAYIQMYLIQVWKKDPNRYVQGPEVSDFLESIGRPCKAEKTAASHAGSSAMGSMWKDRAKDSGERWNIDRKKFGSAYGYRAISDHVPTGVTSPNRGVGNSRYTVEKADLDASQAVIEAMKEIK